MKPLTLKLWRDLRTMAGQVAAIATIIAAGVMVLIITVSNLDAIRLSTTAFYQQNNFADIFSEARRAPNSLVERANNIDGVSLAESRISTMVRIQVTDFEEPIQGRMISLPDGEQSQLNRVSILQGERPQRGQNQHVVISQPFAQAHNLQPGDRIEAIMNGQLERLTITGIGLSPEFIYQLGPADLLPDYSRFGIFWMNREAMASAFDMTGAFNSISVSLQSGAAQEPVIEQLDQLLEPYGSRGAYHRSEQISHQFIEQEIEQLEVMAILLPVIFLGVAAFLLNVLMTRIIRSQRQPIAILKAFGYHNHEIVRHFLSLTFVIIILGVLVGAVVGTWVAEPVAAIYAEYFRFPEFRFQTQPASIVLAAAIALAAGFIATLRAVYKAAKRAPAEAMRPPVPLSFKKSWLDTPLFRQRFSQPVRIIIRNLMRQPLRAILSVFGIALSGGLLLLGSYMFTAMDHMLDIQYRHLLRMNLEVHFIEPTNETELSTLRAQPGVRYAEGFRQVPIRITHSRQQYRTSLLGFEANSHLRQLNDDPTRQPELPTEGILITDYLADYLGVKPGDNVTVEVLSDTPRTLDITVADIVSEPLGLGAYMERRALNRLLREGPSINGAWIIHDQQEQELLFSRLRDMPQIVSIGQISDAEREIREYLDDTILVTMAVLLLLAGSITFAVVYNNARIIFAERERELATLRVLGLTRGEVSAILVGELAIIVMLSIPLAWLIGTGFSWSLVTGMSTDLFRVPFVMDRFMYAFSAVGVLLAASLSIILILRRLFRLDMMSSLKTE
ncbi:ABC transporter permease [Aliidiomarina minuta]|uniref:ABC transporter permease n=1 Tax=Aliidiomarina minuta TaxID=880057 RepID=A0A432W9G8_9GAMM|nr:ABC transporter permease [Aliidiomarina minuta]RUO26238.1 ABC transporter permease [Aliidiomarina minuta]